MTVGWVWVALDASSDERNLQSVFDNSVRAAEDGRYYHGSREKRDDKDEERIKRTRFIIYSSSC